VVGTMNGRGQGLSRDALAGLTVALVLIPQALAYAELAGVPRERGLFAGAAATIAASFFASSRYLQTGPVALTALLTLGALLPLAPRGTEQFAGLAVLLAFVVGCVRLVIGLTRLGRISYLLSQPVMSGFTAAAGILIIASQLPAAVGVSPASPGVISGAIEVVTSVGRWSWWAVAVAGGTVAMILGLRRWIPRLPSALIATLLGLGIGTWLNYPGARLGQLPSSILPPLPRGLPWWELPALILPGVVIAVVGFAEVASISRKYAAKERTEWDPDREFVSQGAANLASALASGLPVGGSFSRTSLNYMARAFSRRSGLFTGLFVLAFLPFVGVLEALPMAVLAGIVVAPVLSLVDIPELLHTWRQSRGQGMVAWGTFVLTLALAPRIDQAVVLGVLAAVGVHLYREMTLKMTKEFKDGVLTLSPRGVLWFGSAPELERMALRAISEHPDATRLVINARGLGRLDFTAAQGVRRVIEEAEEAGLETCIEGVPPQAQRIVSRVLDTNEEG